MPEHSESLVGKGSYKRYGENALSKFFFFLIPKKDKISMDKELGLKSIPYQLCEL